MINHHLIRITLTPTAVSVATGNTSAVKLQGVATGNTPAVKLQGVATGNTSAVKLQGVATGNTPAVKLHGVATGNTSAVKLQGVATGNTPVIGDQRITPPLGIHKTLRQPPRTQIRFSAALQRWSRHPARASSHNPRNPSHG